MNGSTYFSPDYATARTRFRQSIATTNYQHEAYSIDQLGPEGEELTIDVAIGTVQQPKRVVVISSGLHGVEGFLGSAVQLALLSDRQFLSSVPADTNLVLVHALNPYGFAWQRRWNEENVDLNRNFLLPHALYQGSPESYAVLDAFLNPTTPPSRFEPFLLKAIALILRYGMNRLASTLPVGQYDYPKGLFFGGTAPAQTQQILSTHLHRLIGTASEVVHLDFHTGLGAWGTYKLLLDEADTSAAYTRLAKQFGTERISAYQPEGQAYLARGGLGTWCQELFSDRHYDFVTAEFGTYSMIRVLKALRAENRSHWWGQGDRRAEWAKHQLVETFAPANPAWREQCVAQGIDICRRATLPVDE